MRDRPRHNAHHHRDHFHLQAMPLEEVQGLLPPASKTGNRGSLNVTIAQVGAGPGNAAGNYLEPGTGDIRPSPSPLSETTTLPSDNVDAFGGIDPRLQLTVTGDRNTWEGRYRVKEHRRAGKATFQGQVYNFLERPTGWKCFLYHFSVLVFLDD